MQKYNTEEFIEKIRKVHGDKYDYSKVEYHGCHEKVCINCPEHGEFHIIPGNLLQGQGCRLCGVKKYAMERAMPIEKFLCEARKKHGDKYDYSKVEYKNCDTPVCIICPEHGEFWQTPYLHLRAKIGCPKCANIVKYTTEEFIEKAKKIHGNKYDYSKAKYNNAFDKVCIICPEHGEFWQAPCQHLQGRGCPFCVGKNKTTESFIEEAQKIHGGKYIYDKVDYNGAFNPIRVTCPKHGDFIITPHSHLLGCGCSKCGREQTTEKQRLTTEKFINNARKIHGDKYDYSKVEYINAHTPVCIICPKHGEFYKTPNEHVSSKIGCPTCAESALERSVRVFCEKNHINFTPQKTFKWLGLQRIDIYLPDYSTAIECQGAYHFEPYYNATGNTAEENLMEQIERDERKNMLLNENGVQIIYFIPSNLITKTKISSIYSNSVVIQSVNELENILKRNDIHVD